MPSKKINVDPATLLSEMEAQVNGLRLKLEEEKQTTASVAADLDTVQAVVKAQKKEIETLREALESAQVGQGVTRPAIALVDQCHNDADALDPEEKRDLANAIVTLISLILNNRRHATTHRRVRSLAKRIANAVSDRLDSVKADSVAD